MSEIIEFFGPPGSGKSSIFKVLSNTNKEKDNWVTFDKVMPLKPLISKSIKETSQNFIKLLGSGRKPIDTKKLISAGDRFLLRNPVYIDTYLHHLIYHQKSSLNGMDLRFKRADLFYKTIQKIQYFKEIPNSKMVLVEEGLIHRLPTFGSDSKTLEQDKFDLKELLFLIPHPKAVIYIDTELDVLLKRIASRSSIIDMHRSLNKKDLEWLTLKIKTRMLYIVSEIKQKGIPILELDTKQNVNDCALQIKEFLHTLH